MLHDSKKVKILLIIAVIVLAIIVGLGRRALPARGDLFTEKAYTLIHCG